MSQLKVVYTIPELARAAGISRFSMSRLIKSHRVQVSRSGRAIYVFLSSLQKAMPELVESLAQRDAAGAP